MSSIFIYPPTNGQGGGGGTGDVKVIDNLTSTSSTDALSAFQGNVLDKKITAQSDSFDLKLTEQSTTINNTINEKVTELNTKIEEQSLKVASTTQLGNVKIDGDSIKIRPDGTIYVENVASNAIFEIHELILPTTQIGQSEWNIPNEYYTSGDTVIVSHNSTVLDSTMYTLTEVGGVVKVTIQNTTDLPIDKNNVYVVIFHNKIPEPQFTIYDKVLLTDTLSQKTWTIDTPNFDSTKDSVLVIYNTTLLSNNEYTIVGDKLTLLVDTAEAIDKNTVSVFVFSNSRPLGGNYTLPIATTSILGGIKPDGVTLTVDPSSGIATVIGGGGSINLPISANDVTETPNKVYVTSNQRAQIDSNTLENTSQTNRIANLENTLNSIVTTDEKVKMNSLGEANYLQELIDGTTLVNLNGKLSVQSISNLNSTINELNFLQGATSNIQQQINNISGVSTFRGVFSSLIELQSAPNPQAGEYAIVSENGNSDYYFYYGNNWDFSHSSVGVSVIDINNNTNGILSKSRYEKQNSSETPFLDSSGKIKSTNANSAILEVFQFADSLSNELKRTVGSPLNQLDALEQTINKLKLWWTDLANAISNKGVPTSSSNNGEEIIQKISIIPNISIDGVIKKKTKINVISGDNIEVQLDSAISLSDITSTLIEFIAGENGKVIYNLDFNNGDQSNFQENKYVEFDGKMKLKNVINEQLIQTKEENGFYYELILNEEEFLAIDKVKVI